MHVYNVYNRVHWCIYECYQCCGLEPSWNLWNPQRPQSSVSFPTLPVSVSPTTQLSPKTSNKHRHRTKNQGLWNQNAETRWVQCHFFECPGPFLGDKWLCYPVKGRHKIICTESTCKASPNGSVINPVNMYKDSNLLYTPWVGSNSETTWCGTSKPPFSSPCAPQEKIVLRLGHEHLIFGFHQKQTHTQLLSSAIQFLF